MIPIFSKVDLSHIRKQSGRFVEDFETHAKRFEDEEIHPWRGAMKIVGNLPGYVYRYKTPDLHIYIYSTASIVYDM